MLTDNRLYSLLIIGIAFAIIVFDYNVNLPPPKAQSPTITVSEDAVSKERNFNSAKRNLTKMYAENRVTFYCGCNYDQYNKIDLNSCGYKVRKNAARAQRLEWEHIVPAAYFGNNLTCWKVGGRKGCSEHSNLFANFEGDMHNLVPEVGELNGDRSAKIHAVSGLSSSAYGRCDFRINGPVAEPHDKIKGDVARIWLYMSHKYGMYLSDEMRATFEKWSKDDPADDKERWRNRRIKEIQGDSNIFIEP